MNDSKLIPDDIKSIIDNVRTYEKLTDLEKEIDEKEGKSRKSDEKGIKEGKEVVKLKEKEQRKNEREKESKKEQNEREREKANRK